MSSPVDPTLQAYVRSQQRGMLLKLARKYWQQPIPEQAILDELKRLEAEDNDNR